MRVVLGLLMGVLLPVGIWAQAPPDDKVGEFQASFTLHSPLNTPRNFAERFGWEGPRYNLLKESFSVYVPEDYQPDTPYGLFVWISPTESGAVPQPGMKAILDKHRLIWIGANNAGNSRVPFWHRFGLALDAAENMKRRYRIDDGRIYVGGFSGGGRSASVVAIGFPEVFQGGLYAMGCNYFRRIPVANTPGKYYSHFQEPTAQILHTVMNRNRYVFFTGSGDFNRDETKATYDRYLGDGFKHVTYIETPGLDHRLPADVNWFEESVVFLDAPIQAAQREAKQRPAEIVLAEARQAESAGEFGKALRLFREIVEAPEATEAVTRLEKRAEAELTKIEKAVRRESYPDAAKMLKQYAQTYAGSEFGEQAQALLDALINSKADALEARARAAEDAGDYAKALQLYELYLTYFPEAARYATVKAHVEALKAKHSSKSDR